jgi:hypothetical protein
MVQRAPILAPLLLLALAAAPACSYAASRHLEASTASFAVESPCARTVTIQPDPTLTGHVVVDATADHDEEVAQLLLEAGTTAKLHHAGHECWEPSRESDFEPTMSLTIRVPPAMAVAIDESGGAEYTIGALQGPLSLDISGGVKLHADRSAALTVDLSGGATIDVARVDGRAKAEISGGGNITIDQATLQDLTLEVSGGGAFTLRNGSIARANIELSGAASVQVGGTTGDATVDLSGAGSVHFGKVTGHMTKDVSGWGSVTVDSQ